MDNVNGCADAVEVLAIMYVRLTDRFDARTSVVLSAPVALVTTITIGRSSGATHMVLLRAGDPCLFNLRAVYDRAEPNRRHAHAMTVGLLSHENAELRRNGRLGHAMPEKSDSPGFANDD